MYLVYLVVVCCEKLCPSRFLLIYVIDALSICILIVYLTYTYIDLRSTRSWTATIHYRDDLMTKDLYNDMATS